MQVWLRDVPLPGTVARPRAKDGAREAAVLLRAEGRTYDEIATELGVSKGTLSLWLRDLPDLEPARAPNEPAREVARRLRSEGWLLREIAEELQVVLRTVHGWTRDLPVPPRAVHGRSAEECRRMTRERWDVELAVRERERQAVMATAADEVGELTPRELELVAVAAYWCEGAKSKPWRRTEFVKFVNSDPDLIRLFLSWLRHVGVPDHHLSPAVSIHESADVAAATAFWSEVTGIAVERFGKTSLKRHTPRTVRKNVGEDYRGCLTIGVRQSRELYQRLAGTWRGIALGAQSVLPDGAD